MSRVSLLIAVLSASAILSAAANSKAASESTLTVTLPTAGFNPSVPIGIEIIQPVVTTNVDSSLNYIGFQGDFTFDSSVVSFSSPFAEPAGLTSTGNWHVSLGILGAGTIKTARISAFSNDFVPLLGFGTLFNLKMLRVSGTPGVTSPLLWKPSPDQFIFVDADLNTFTPDQNSGLITITGPTPTPTAIPTASPTPSTPTPTASPTASPVASPTPGILNVSLPNDIFITSVPVGTVILEPVPTTNIDSSLNYVGFQGDFTFDETVFTFSGPLGVEKAGLTSGNWNVSGHVLPGGGPIRTLRLSAFSNDFIPLSGSGTLFNLRMLRVSGTPGAASPLVWKPGPDQFVFVDADLNTFIPGQNNGLITIAAPTPTPTPMVNISGFVFSCSNPTHGSVADVTLVLSGTSAGSTLSDGSGIYQFSSLVGGGSYTVTPTKSAVTPGSSTINTVDALAAQRHFLGINRLTGCRLTAADVTGDSIVDTMDVLAIQQFFLGYPSKNVGNYQFIPANRSYPAAVTAQNGQNYGALIFGDVASPFVDRPGD